MSCYFSWRCLFLVLCVLHSMFWISFGCFTEERTALMGIRTSLVSANSEVPKSWGQGDDCCSWERIRCNNITRRISHLELSFIYLEISTAVGRSYSTPVSGCWNLSLTIFSSFHELQLLDLSLNQACLQNFEGLQGLSKLQCLDLSSNSLMGSISGSLSKLVSLEVINLNGNNISGTLHDTAFRNIMNLRELLLRSNQFSGSLPASLLSLPRLEYLDLSENLFLGHIPINSYWNCSSLLQVLKLSKNNLSGKFDFFWLKNCTELREIDLSGNANLVVQLKFPGWVPPFQLKVLTLSGCNLEKSIITEPHFLRTQHHLQMLDLSNNNLPGSMPNWLFTNEAALVYLDLANNLLVGSLDQIWQHQSNLQLVNISMNQVEGQLPANISPVFPNMTILDVSHNVISGVIPPSLCSIGSMAFMDLSNNNFTGEVPACLFTDISMLKILTLSNNNLGGLILGGASNLPFLWAIYLDSNKFEGTLPRNLSGNVRIMDLHDNKLSGELDTSFWNLSSLQALILASNSLTGQIRPEICKLTSVELLDLSGNSFAGPIPNCSSTLYLSFLNMSGNSLSGSPNAFFNSSYIKALDLSYNQFTGNLAWTQYLSEISLLSLGRNKFEGKIYSGLCHLQYVSIIDFSHNRLSGSIPPCIGDIPFEDLGDDQYFWPTTVGSLFGGGFAGLDSSDSGFSYDSYYDLQGFTFATKGSLYTYGRNFFNLMSGIDLSANMLSGEIPRELGNLSHIKSLNLSYNLLTGLIPATFANMGEIESLDLSHNRLNGPIPWELTRLSSLEVFSVAYNNLSGCVPDTGQFGTFDMDSYKGNNNLHKTSQGSRSCTSSSGPVASSDTVGKASDDSDPILFVVSVVSFVLTFWATVAFLFCHSFGQRVILKL